MGAHYSVNEASLQICEDSNVALYDKMHNIFCHVEPKLLDLTD